MTNVSGMKSWKNQPIYMTVVRLWLGVTWTYGGWAKAVDPGYLDPASPDYFGAQITMMVDRSPIGFLLSHMVEHADLFAWFVMISEFAVGIAILAGVAMQAAALGGFSISVILWLSVSFHVKPYFLGNDLPYAVLWLALFLMIRHHSRGRSRTGGIIPNLRDRREVMQMAGVAVASVIAAIAGGSFKPKRVVSTNNVVAKVSDVAIGQVKQFTSLNGAPAYLFRTKAGVFAYSAICTHQGCTVGFDSTRNLLICPCHQARFDPTQEAKAVGGPTQTPLAKISVSIVGENIVQA